jgi:hypothetical protein
VDKNAPRISDIYRNRRYTAARPSRILTVFPFDYPKAQLQDLLSGYIIFKERKNAITPLGFVKQK